MKFNLFFKDNQKLNKIFVRIFIVMCSFEFLNFMYCLIKGNFQIKSLIMVIIFLFLILYNNLYLKNEKDKN